MFLLYLIFKYCQVYNVTMIVFIIGQIVFGTQSLLFKKETISLVNKHVFLKYL